MLNCTYILLKSINSEEIKRGGTAPYKTREEANEQLANKYPHPAIPEAIPSIFLIEKSRQNCY